MKINDDCTNDRKWGGTKAVYTGRQCKNKTCEKEPMSEFVVLIYHENIICN